MKKMIGLLICLLNIYPIYGNELTVKIALSPAGSFEAKSDKLKGAFKKDGVKYSAENMWIKVEELKTGIDLRDEHFHKHLNFEKFPKITFTNMSAADGKGVGTLTVNNEKKEVAFTYKMKSPKVLEAILKVKASEFKLKKAEYMGIGVSDDVEIVVLMNE
jgi:polyisoprenoid-binding protein YceI